MLYTTTVFERCLYFNVNALARAVNRIWDEAFKELGLSPAHAYLLRLVLASPGISHKAIASELKLEKSTITRFVDSLQEKGLVQRSKLGAEDNREQRVFPTDKAKSMKEALEATCDALYRRMCGNLGEAEMKALVAQLRKTARLLS
ncbi:MarR family transcriptional regulator [Methylocaldum sp. BRCS4]|nr:MarR family transcriptional regulator [Methylocaldum sp. BRCS4]